jgi:UDP-N-acetylglucosamine--N-acetylmuramyl-(pentapeptide) pyrophosphoryl-undecaprenol N-acetylglucosamine transferase
MSESNATPLIAVACGGTGGHLFPGLSVGQVLQDWGVGVALLVSKKEVDQEAVKSAQDMRILSLPAVALQNGRWLSFARGFWGSFRLARGLFRELRPRGVLAMGGFTSAPPILAGKSLGSAAFLHESNSIPGRANRWLSPWVDGIFVGFPTAGRRLYHQSIRWIGTPIRRQFERTDPGPCRIALGLKPEPPVLAVMGGSQGASGINTLLKAALPMLARQAPDLQFIHLTGMEDYDAVQTAYRNHQRRAAVRPFLTEMELVLGAATLAVNRAGASSLAELAAMQVPSLLIPYPHATDNHQFFNARAFADSGAARMIEQASASSEGLAQAILEILENQAERQAMQRALVQWHFPQAAEDIAGHILEHLGIPKQNPDLVAQRSGAIERPWRTPGSWSAPQLKFQLPSFKSRS